MQTIVCFILFGILFGLLIYEFWGYNKKYTATKFIWTKPTSTETINLCEESGYLSVSDDKSELGNLITQYATLYAQAKTYNATPIISKTDKDELRHLFQHLSIPAYQNEGCDSPFYCEVDPDHLSSRLFEDKECNVKITGYSVRMKVISGFRNELIKKDFQFADCNQIQANDFLVNAKKQLKKQGKDIKFVGIHVRRSQFGEGDFEKYMQSRSEGGFYLSKAYFKTAMDYFRTKFSKKVIFIVSSDDQDWCIRNLKDPDVVFTRTWQTKPDIPQQAYLDFTILAKCNHSIISFGSFGFWSAYLRPKGVTLFLTNDYRRENINVNLINSKISKDIEWIPWKDPCVAKVNNKWQFKDGTKDCVK